MVDFVLLRDNFVGRTLQGHQKMFCSTNISSVN